MLFTSQRRKVRILFLLGELVLTALAFEAAYWSRAVLHVLPNVFFLDPGIHMLALTFCATTWVGIGHAMDTYGGLEVRKPGATARQCFRQGAWGIVALVIFAYVLRLELSRAFLALFAVYGTIVLLVFRLYTGRLVRVLCREYGPSRFVLIAGTGARAVNMAELLERNSDEDVRLLGFLALDEPGPDERRDGGRRFPVYRRNRLPAMLRGNGVVDELIFAVEPAELECIRDLLLLCDEQGVRSRVIVDFFPQVNSQMRLETFGRIPLLTFTSVPSDELKLLVKRALDLLIATVALVLASPVMAAAAIAIKLTSPGPLIFRQGRCGLNGRRFTVYKFRSMVADAELHREELLCLSHRSVAAKIPNDPRLTPVGRILRKFSIDELPQLLNVIKGEMALVGPRPALPSEVEQYQGWQRRRLRMRPGLTCLWAVNGRDRVDFETWMKLDMKYIDNWSLGLDWEIIFKTIPQVLTGKGAS